MQEHSLLEVVALAGALTLLIALVAAPLVIRLCTRIGWIDRPDRRKQHDGLVPIAGGLTILVALVSVAPFFARHVSDLLALWLGAALVFAIGFADDRKPIRSRYRFVVQLAAAFLFVQMSGTSVDHVRELFGPQEVALGMMAVPIAVIGIAGLTNAVNMIDGIDGLAGSVVLVALGWVLVALGLVAIDMADVEAPARRVGPPAVTAAMLIGALCGFLAFNLRTPWRKRAAMFLGDGGSMSLGFLLAALLVYVSGAFGAVGMPPVTALWIAAIPLCDIFSAILRRDLAGATPMTPDRKHLHHLLIAQGLSPARAVLLLKVAGVVLGLVGVLGWRFGVADYVMFWSLIALFAAYFAASQLAWERLERRAGADVRAPGTVPSPAAPSTSRRRVPPSRSAGA